MTIATASRTIALDDLIAPITALEFFSTHWGQRHLLSPGARTRHAHLFSWDTLSEILSSHRFDSPRLRLFRGGRVIPTESYILAKTDRRGNRYWTHDAKAVASLMNQGALLHITSIGETWAPLAAAAAQLEQDLCARVQVNLHAGFASSKGFHRHWDGHDVYAVQIDGRKKWRLYGFTEEAPLPVAPDEKHGAPLNEIWEGTIDTGHVLYVPRGCWHETEYVDAASLHLTFAVQHPTGMDFLQWLMSEVARHPASRRDIPAVPFELPVVNVRMSADAYLSQLSEALGGVRSTATLGRFLTQFRAGLGRSNQIRLTPRQKERSHVDLD